jgi:predicted P-loop ATPase
VTKADLDLIEDRRDQIWAEAYKAFQLGEPWWIDDDAGNLLAQAEAEVREEYDVWVELFNDKLAGQNGLTTAQALHAIGVPYERMDRRAEIRAAKCLRKLGFERKTPKDRYGKTVRRWERPS